MLSPEHIGSMSLSKRLRVCDSQTAKYANNNNDKYYGDFSSFICIHNLLLQLFPNAMMTNTIFPMKASIPRSIPANPVLLPFP